MNKKFLRMAGIILLLLLLSATCFLFVACDETEDDSGIHASVTDDFKTEYFVGESFVAVGGLKTYFDIDYFSVVPVTADMVTGFDTSRPGTIIVLVSYGDFVASVPVTVHAVKATSLTLDAERIPKVIYENKDFPTDLTFSAVLSDGTTVKDIAVTPSMLGGFDSSVLGGQNVTVSYLGATASFLVTIKKDVYVSISLENARTEYEVKESLYVTGAYLNILYESTDTDRVALKKSFVTGFDTTLGGEYTATVTYSGLTCDYDYTVIRRAQSFELDDSSLPSVYEKGSTLPSTGTGILIYNDSTQETIAPLTTEHISGFDTTTAGSKVAEITVAGCTDTYAYTVLPTIVSATPYRYTASVPQNTPFDGLGGLLVVYEDGADVQSESLAFLTDASTKEEVEDDAGVLQRIVTDRLRIEYRTSAAGDITQKIYFRTAVIEFTVHVYDETERATAVNGISIAGNFAPIRLGDPINVSGVKVGIEYKYLAYEVVDCLPSWVDAEMPESIEGDYEDVEVTVSYLGAEAYGTVRVLSAGYASKVTSIHVSGIPSYYLIGDELSFDQASMYVVYGGGFASDVIEVLPSYVSGFDSSSSGEKTMKVTYGECTCNLPYIVLSEEDKTRVTDVSISGFTPLLFVGDTIENIPLTYELILTLGYGYGRGTATFADEDVTLTGGPFTREGWQEILLTCRGYEKTLYVTVYPASDKECVTGIAVLSDNISAEIGRQPDLSQLLLVVVYGHGYSEKTITLSSPDVEVDYGPLNTTEVGLARTKVKYANCTCDLYVNFISGDSGNVLQRLEIETGAKAEYVQGEAFGGVNLILHYKNGTERISVTAEMVPDFDTQTVGEHTVTVSYGGRGVLYTYTVSAAPEQQEEEE